MTFQTAFTAPHAKAAEVGQSVLDEGGTASEAMVAAAAVISVEYPHMNSIGGDGFWLICKKDQPPIAIDACGAASGSIDVNQYQTRYTELPESGGESAITMAGTISGWDKALQLDGGNMTLSRLLQPAIDAARDGIDVTESLAAASRKTFDRLQHITSFNEVYLKQGQVLQQGDKVCNPALASTFSLLAERGLDDFYRGDIARNMAQDLADLGSPITLQDLHAHQAKVMPALHLSISKGTLYNIGAPTQGVASLLILGIYDQLVKDAKSEVDHMHLLIEATKQAFIIRDSIVTDESCLSEPLQPLLSRKNLDYCASKVSMTKALPWPHVAKTGDTVWMGATDQYGTMVSFIQSVYWEFGSGVVLPNSGVLWNIRSKSFSLDSAHHNVLAPNKKPFHTLNPAYAELKDGRRMVYGTMGGEGQPQTQACLFSRYLYQEKSLIQSVAEPRWLLGRTWGDSTTNLRLEDDLYHQYGDELQQLGHEISRVDNLNELMGHAGAIVLNSQGLASATSDPRSDGTYLLGEVYDN